MKMITNQNYNVLLIIRAEKFGSFLFDRKSKHKLR